MTALELFENNKRLVYKIYNSVISDASNWFRKYHGEDVLEAGYIGLYLACCRYDDKQSAFSTYASTYIRGYMLKSIQSLLELRKKDVPDFISLDAPMYSTGDDEDITIKDTLFVEPKDDVSWIIDDDRLTERHKEILRLVADGYNNTEIGKMIGISQSNVYRNLRRIGKILKEDLNGTV